MADASELFRNGHLAEAIAAQIEIVRAKPGDQPSRLFLFELLAFGGDLDRATKQVDALTVEDPDLHLAALNYRQCLQSEQARRKIFSGEKPEFFAEPDASTALRLEALGDLAAGDKTSFVSKMGKANAEIPAFQGTINGTAFNFLRDADDVFAGVFEVFAKGKYYWVPFGQVASLAMNPPKFPRDLIWIPANLTLNDGSTGPVFLPGLYLGSHEHGLETVKLGRERDWIPADKEHSDVMRGFGPRVYLAGDNEVNLSDIRELVVTSA